MFKQANELFLNLDDSAGGAHQMFKRKLKFLLRHLWFNDQINQFKDYLVSKNLLALLAIDPSIQVKCTRPYLKTGLDARARVEAQIAFYEWFLSISMPETICQLYKTQTTLVTHDFRDQVTQIELKAAFGLGREGELAVFFKFNGETLYKASFTVLPALALGISTNGYVMYIGGFQGERNSDERIKEATKTLERIKPTHLLFHALQSIAQAWGLAGIVATSDSTQVFMSYKNTLAKRIKTSYDSAWLELGGSKDLSNGLWVLPLTWSARPENEIESKKRAAYRRRNALKENFMDMCRQGAFHLLQPVRHDSQATADL
jgi:uncharacterized protein VirK/YbjX